ncbi:MAG: GNAT family N-acetyltransferase [Anaerolineae bacterium]
MIVRPLTAQDIPLVSAWIVTIPLWKRYGLTVEKLSGQLATALDNDLLLTVDTEESAVGLAWCLPRGGFGRSAYLKMLGVRPDQSGRGLGAILLDHLETLVTSNELFLLASDFNSDAHRFYQRQGYQQIGAIPDFVLTGVTEMIFYKKIRPVSR